MTIRATASRGPKSPAARPLCKTAVSMSGESGVGSPKSSPSTRYRYNKQIVQPTMRAKLIGRALSGFTEIKKATGRMANHMPSHHPAKKADDVAQLPPPPPPHSLPFFSTSPSLQHTLKNTSDRSGPCVSQVPSFPPQDLLKMPAQPPRIRAETCCFTSACTCTAPPSTAHAPIVPTSVPALIPSAASPSL